MALRSRQVDRNCIPTAERGIPIYSRDLLEPVIGPRAHWFWWNRRVSQIIDRAHWDMKHRIRIEIQEQDQEQHRQHSNSEWQLQLMKQNQYLHFQRASLSFSNRISHSTPKYIFNSKEKRAFHSKISHNKPWTKVGTSTNLINRSRPQIQYIPKEMSYSDKVKSRTCHYTWIQSQHPKWANLIQVWAWARKWSWIQICQSRHFHNTVI